MRGTVRAYVSLTTVLLAVVLTYGAAVMVSRARAAAAVPVAMQSTGNDAIVPFKIHVSDDVLTDLKVRLARTRFPDEIDGAGWDYGTDLAYLKELVGYWKDRFDWRAQERRLNAFDQFTTNIDGLRVHFIHQRSKETNALPLLMTHGWPGSFFEYTKVIAPLTESVSHGGRREEAFHFVGVSIPGYGFSDKPRQRGYSPRRMAAINAKLMARLGYTRYGVQGGDWGGQISRFNALDDSAHVVGLHLNRCYAGPPRDAKDPYADLTPAEIARIKERAGYSADDNGYSQIQGTRPQSLGYSLNDSPAGLAAWMIEKWRYWSDSEGDVEKRFTKDELLTNVMIYWVTQTATSSARLYYESRKAGDGGTESRRVDVPTACAEFPKDRGLPPRRWMERDFNLKRFTIMPRGGHFAAVEEPQLLVDDMRAFFHDLR